MEVIRGPPSPVQQLAVKEVFERLSPRQKLYAHHTSRASWHGSRIIMRQSSPEATGIFDFIIEMFKSCGGQWQKLVKDGGVVAKDLEAFLEYAGHFLYNMGNYWAEGDQKFVPDLSPDALRRLAQASPAASAQLESVIGPMLEGPPFVIGYPSESAQSAYYPGENRVSKQEITRISEFMQKHGIEPENTRIRKVIDAGQVVFEILQASTDAESIRQWDNIVDLGTVRICGGDHSQELSRVCASLLSAKEHVENETQAQVIDHYIQNFTTGDMEAFRNAQKAWVKDKAPVIESIMGFVEPYRDPHGVRGEWEGFVGISDPVESTKMLDFVRQSTTFIRLLPWAVAGLNDGKGPFEKDVFVAPDYTSSHSLAFCASYSFEATNVPNYNDIRETCGFKNIVVANRINAKNDRSRQHYYVHDSEAKRYGECTHIIRFITTAIHELLGHGSGKLLSETSPGVYNFDPNDPPISPLTGKAIETWYLKNQTWTGLFGTIAPSVEECRAMLVPLYLIDNKDLLAIFGHDDTTDITADELHYNTYLQIGVEGLQGLAYYNAKEGVWGQAHKRAHWAILNHLLIDGGGVLVIEHDAKESRLTIKVDRSKLVSHGKPSLGRFLCQIHIWRCTANVSPCRSYYERVTSIEGEHEEWRKLVAGQPEPRTKYAHANTFLVDGNVTVKEYEETNEGLIESWVDRNV